MRPLLALLLGVLAASAHADVAVPQLRARVTDLTGTLRPEQAAALEQKLAAFEAAKGSQVAVLVLPTTEPETIEQFGIRVGEAWKIGRKGVDDGAILIVAKDDRRLRIEVGYGLEGALNDATAKRIISETITPHFKQGQFYEGIDAGVNQMIRVIQGEPLPEPRRVVRSADDFGSALGWLFLLAFIVGPLLRAVLGRVFGSGASAGLAGLIVYVVTGIALMAIVAAIVTLFATLLGGIGGRRRWSSGRGWGGWGGGGFGGGGFGGGGGFSGGGGSFGGGGASGSW